VVLIPVGQDKGVSALLFGLRLATLLSFAGDGDDLPRSLADDFPKEAVVQQDDPGQDPLRPPAPPRKQDFTPKPPEEAPLEHPHESIGGFFRTHFAAKAWEENVWRDYLTEPPVLVPLGLAAGAGVVSHWDKSVAQRIQGTMGGRRKIGDLTMYTLVGGSIVLCTLFPGEDRNGWDNLWEQGEVFGVTALVTSTLKVAAPRLRPSGGHHSFPSGHTSSAFAAASMIDDNFGGVAGVSAYGLAGLTGYSRIEAKAHYPSDVLAGAAIGILSAQILDHLHWGNGQRSHGIARGGLRLEVGPLDDRGGLLGFSFDY
jgi:hypothetical protein